jgi:hypothetical protein
MAPTVGRRLVHIVTSGRAAGGFAGDIRRRAGEGRPDPDQPVPEPDPSATLAITLTRALPNSPFQAEGLSLASKVVDVLADDEFLKGLHGSRLLSIMTAKASGC